MGLTEKQKRWIDHPSTARILTAEFPAYESLPGEYIATNWWMPEHTGSLGAVRFEGRLRPWRLERQVRSTWLGMSGQRAIIDFAPMDVLDEDGGVSRWLLRADEWIGRPVVVRWGHPDWLDIDEHIIRLHGLVDRIERVNASGKRIIRIVVKSRLTALDKAVPDAFYDESEAPDAQANIKPLTYGFVANHELIPLDTTNLIYGVSGNGGTPVKLRDRGIVLTKGSEINPGLTDWVDNDDGTVTLGNIDGRITADTQGATWPNVDAATVFISVINDADINPSWIDINAINYMAAGYQLDVGYFTATQVAAYSILDQLADSAAAAWFVDTAGLITAKPVQVPNTPAVSEFSPINIIGGVRRSDAVQPTSGLLLGVRKSWANQSADDVASELTAKDRRDLVARQEQVIHGQPSSDSPCVSTLLINKEQAAMLAARLYEYIGGGLWHYDFNAATGAALVDLMDVAAINHDAQPELEPLTDERGEAIVNELWQPMQAGVVGYVVRLVEEYPAGFIRGTVAA